jgi:DNA-binding IclR family transcriptional regulator
MAVIKHLVDRPADVPSWTFLTNHAHVLVCMAQDPEVRIAEMARKVGVGERAVHSIVHDLVEAGYVTRTRSGRHNVYDVRLDRPLRHPLEAAHELADVFRPLVATAPQRESGARRRDAAT